jgi:hypothetical protein
MMQQFSVTDAALAGFRMVREHPKTVAIWGVLLMVLSGLSTILLIAVGGPQLQAFGEMDPSSAADLKEMAAVMAPMAPIILLSGALNLVISAVMITGVTRMILRPWDSATAYLRLSVEELRQGVALFLYSLLILAIYFGAVFVGAVVIGTVGAASGGQGVLVGLAVLIVVPAIFGITLYAVVRFSFAGVLTFAEGRVTIMDSLPLTKHRFWPLFGAYLLAFVLFLVVYAAILVLGTATAAIFGGLTGAGAVFQSDVSSLAAFLTPVGVIRLVIIGALSVLTMLILFAPAPEIYRQLKADKLDTFV